MAEENSGKETLNAEWRDIPTCTVFGTGLGSFREDRYVQDSVEMSEECRML